VTKLQSDKATKSKIQAFLIGQSIDRYFSAGRWF